jgi:hypothetical protein
MLLSALFAITAPASSLAAETIYTLPQGIHWMPITGEGVPPGASEAILRGKPSRPPARDQCDQLFRIKFPNGFVYPWHVNGTYDIYTVLTGTLVIGFDKHHSKSAERVLPAGSVMQGLQTEPHYGRAIGETIFDVYRPCGAR